MNLILMVEIRKNKLLLAKRVVSEKTLYTNANKPGETDDLVFFVGRED